MKFINQIFTEIKPRQHTESGLLLVAVSAWLAYYKKQDYYLFLTFVVSLITLIVPVIFYPFTILWLALSKILNAVSSRVMLTVIFFLVVTPVAIVRKMMRKDSMKIKQFKKSPQSVMIARNHVYVREDLLHTF